MSDNTFDFSQIDPPPVCMFTVRVRRGDRWYDVGSYESRTLAQRVADQWGGKRDSLISTDPRSKPVV